MDSRPDIATRSLVQGEEGDDSRGRILDAAERAFASGGFEGAGMKAIAREAGVAQGLLHYHFEGKEGLYNAVVKRRASAINAARLAALEAVDLAAPDALEAVLDALLRPPLSAAAGGRDYARIFAVLAVGAAREQALVREHYDATAERFIAALHRAEPGLDLASAVWGYSFAIGALVMVVGRSGRIERLAGGAVAPVDDEETIRRLVAYAAGGLRQVAGGAM